MNSREIKGRNEIRGILEKSETKEISETKGINEIKGTNEIHERQVQHDLNELLDHKGLSEINEMHLHMMILQRNN